MAGKNAENVYSEALKRGVWQENPVFVQVLGLCPTLAVSNSVKNALAMSLAVLFVLVCSNVLVSLVRKIVVREVRIAIFILIIATFGTVVDYIIQAVSVPLYKAMGLFISLIVVNCIILGRAEAFASRNTVFRSMLDGVGMACGFSLALLALGTVREVLGAGTFLGFHLFGSNYEPWVIFLLPSGGFFTLATWLLVFAWWKERSNRRREQEAAKS
ncbi:MAG TPA: electron transport complex subunit E [Candidatus Hydrogenedentes bacterium]|nr:electron transport complex subunit E [Candidatus Hydrogenedentota bacterium]